MWIRFKIKRTFKKCNTKRNIRQCFNELDCKCDKNITYKKASGLKTSIGDPNFVYWLILSQKINQHVDTLFNQFPRQKWGESATY